MYVHFTVQVTAILSYGKSCEDILSCRFREVLLYLILTRVDIDIFSINY